jgi:hypothetical protein
VTAGEDQTQPLVGDRGLLVHLLFLLALSPIEALEATEQLGLALEVSLAADPVDGPVPGDRDEPAGRVGGSAVPGPALQRLLDGVLEGVLGEIEVAEDADQGGEDAPVLLAEQAAELGVGSRRYSALTSAGTGTIGRTSTEP